MNRLWNVLMRPIFEEIHAKYIIEVGSDTGLNTRNILEYCLDNNAHMAAIDPFPKFDIDKFKIKYGDKFEIYTELSLSRLPLLDDYDCIILDGDHNWYTVYNELKTIEKTFKNKKFPLIFLHDTGWPYARRDLYYNPDNIPEIFRQPYKKLGMYPGQSDLKENGGMNTSFFNSIYENTPKNGVLTAVEDFIQESDQEFCFDLIPVYHGLGILYIDNYKLKSHIENIINSTSLLEILEEERVKLYIESRFFKNDLNQNKKKTNYLEEKIIKTEQKLDLTEINLRKSNDLRKEKDLDIKELKSQISNISSNLIEMKYLSNNDRSIKNRIISKFPRWYILFNRKNGSFKNALVNIKGYKSIKNKHLFDIGYYLKNNNDIRLSGVDPLIHYIYYGYKEGRNPSANFDGKYYYERYAHLKASNLNPLVHYSLYGIKEGKKPIASPVKQIKEKSAYNLTKKFKSLKAGIIQFTPDKTKNPYYTMIGDELISRGIDFKYLNDFSSIENVLKKNRKSIFHLHQPEPYYHSDNEVQTLEMANKFLEELKHIKILGARLVWTMHNPVAHNRRFQKIDEMVNEELFVLSDHIIVLGRDAKETLLKRNVTTPISVVMHPSFKEFYGPKPDKVQTRKELGLPSDAIIFGNIGHIKPYKGLEFIIDAFNRFTESKSSSEEIVLCIAGTSPDSDYIASIQEKCSSNILIINRDLSDSELIKFVSALDYTIFAFKDIWGSSGVVLSLSYGVPVIVPEIGCMPDYIQHLNNGLLYTHNDLNSMGQAFEKAMSLEYYDHLQYICDSYSEEKSISKIADEFLSIYIRVLENNNSKIKRGF